jgi:hypothetical protein
VTISRRKPRDARKRVLRAAEEIVTQKSQDSVADELSRIGIVWCGILDLDDAIPPSEVAAMLAAADLVRATRYIDSEDHWVSAAAYSALGAHSEPEVYDQEEIVDLKAESSSNPIGFSPNA